MNFEQKNGGEHCTADNSPQYVFHCDADENEFAGFILKNLPLVRAVARRFSGRGAEPEELVQAGSVGLIIAAKSFDNTRGVSFASYAFRFIEGEIRRFIRDNTFRAAQSKGCILTAAIEFQMRITQVRVRTASSYLSYAFRLMKKKQNFMSLIIPCKRKTLRRGQMQICLPRN